ncbi:hypothetical protein LIER_27847 [Lithospermum erythrorhizon]|uniref:Uncharacterized protein n=1 Tax=Lithospermum erythrorhizon TaxID=34254 RepID=A0AAV3RDU0_LITER
MSSPAASKLLRSSTTLLRRHHLHLHLHLLRPATTTTTLFIPTTQNVASENFPFSHLNGQVSLLGLSENIPFSQLNGQFSSLGLSAKIEYCNLKMVCRGNDHYKKATTVDDDEDEDHEQDFNDDDETDDDIDWDDVRNHEFNVDTSDSD